MRPVLPSSCSNFATASETAAFEMAPLSTLGTLIKTQADLERVQRQFGNASEQSFGTLN